MISYFLSGLRGSPIALDAHAKSLAGTPDVCSGINELLKRKITDDNLDQNNPIFLFSAGWRSGSTLAQRLLMSDPNVFIWGEPYDHCGIVQALANTTKAFTPEWPPERYFYDGSDKSDLSSRWIADLYPSLEDLRQGHRAIFETMFAKPAMEAGAERWGLKEVRLGVEHAYYLKWLFPNARFLFMYRNPLEAYRSYCGHGRSWYDEWPNKPIFTATAFGRHWSKLVNGYLDQASKVDGLIIPYEELIADDTVFDNLETYLGITINRAILKAKIGSSDRSGEKIWVSRLDKWLLKRAVEKTARSLGYEW